MSTDRVYWTCESCGRETDGRSGMDDAMDCFCDRCQYCLHLTFDCQCDEYEYYDPEEDQ